MSAIKVSQVSKSFAKKKVVNDLSFEVKKGEIFGLLGPNGAGKTTTIRMIMNIFFPDKGEIEILGEKLNPQLQEKIGYLPEERGLYRRITVLDSLVYLASLKGMERKKASKEAKKLLKKVDLTEWGSKKINDLSSGMQQKIQFLTTIIHNPQILIFDEPFFNLDPINREVILNLILEEKEKGKAVILSTHLMDEVERLCDRVILINLGKNILYGRLSKIKKQFAEKAILLDYEGNLKKLKNVKRIKDTGLHAELILEKGIDPKEILKELISQNVKINRFEIAAPSLNEIFIETVKGLK